MNRDHAQRVYFEQIKRLVRLESVLARYGVLDELKRSGRQFTGCCPIHNGTNKKQFVVDLDKQLWRCFSPEHDEGGGILEFVAAMENVEVREAALRIADWFAIRLEPGQVQPIKRRKTVSGLPSHKVFVVEDKDEENADESKSWWTRVGSAWPHKDGLGLNVVLSAVPMNGRLVLREFTEADAKKEEEEKKAKTSNKRR